MAAVLQKCCPNLNHPPAPLSRLCTPARPVKMVWLKMKLPVKPVPIRPTATLDRPAGGILDRPSRQICACHAPNRLKLVCQPTQPRCHPPTDACQLSVGVQPLGRVLLDCGNVHAAAEADQQEQAQQLQGCAGVWAGAEGRWPCVGAAGWPSSWPAGAVAIFPRLSPVGKAASTHGEATQSPHGPLCSPCPLAAARRPGAGAPASRQACQTGPTASKKGPWWPAGGRNAAGTGRWSAWSYR